MFPNDYGASERENFLMSGVYGWMSCALAITAATAYYIAHNASLFITVQQPGVMVGLCIAQLIFVFGLVFFINRMSYMTTLIMFLLYACSLGITLSTLFYVYTYGSIVSTFLTTALTFGVMSVYGYFTKSDLTAMGNLAFMVLVGLVIGMVINFFLKSPQFDYVISGIGVIVFVLLTAYDTQKIKQLSNSFFGDTQSVNKLALMGALTLYLDFINMFLFLLRFLGKRDER